MRTLRCTYLIALTTVAVLSISAQWFVQDALSDRETDGHVIDIAGRQRMLSQRIAKGSLVVAASRSPREVANALAELNDDYERWAGSHRGLVDGNSNRGLPGLTTDDPLRPAFAKLDAKIQEVDAGIQILTRSNASPADRQRATEMILAAERAFLPEMHALVGQLAERSDAKIAELRTIEWILLAITLAVLLAEALLIFEPAIRTLRRQVRELDELRLKADRATEAKSAFLANMSHEIRTPMTAILGFADILRSPSTTESDAIHAAGTIHRNGEHLLALINDILDLSKIESGELELEKQRVDVREVVHDALRICETKARDRGLALIFEIDGKIPEWIQGDSLRLRQCLINLVANAIRFTEAGYVKVRTSVDGDGMLRFDVVDTGCGIPEDRLDAIFGAFTQADSATSRQHGGTGLGLSITRELATAMGGRVEVNSKVDVGSTFTMTVATGAVSNSWVSSPLDAQEPAPTPQAADPVKLDARVLLVDDTADNRLLYARMLTSAGAVVETAWNGLLGQERAMNALDDGEPFDVILMDGQMPVLDGYGATHALRTLGYSGPIVMLTANALSGERERSEAAGCDSYLSKPVSRATLIREVDRYARQARERRPTDAAATDPRPGPERTRDA